VDDHKPAKIPEQSPVITALDGINPDAMTPMQALAKIAELKQMLDRKDENT